MKKILRRIITLACALMLFAIPITDAYASTTPTLVIDLPSIGVKVYSYRVVEYNDGASTALYDTSTSDQTIPVPAGKTLNLQINTDANGHDDSLQVTIFSSGFFYNEVLTTTNGGFFIDIPAQSTDMNYHVWLNAYYTDVTLYDYTTTIH